MKHTIDTKILESVLDYLKERPFKEVADLIHSILQDAKPVDEKLEEQGKAAD